MLICSCVELVFLRHKYDMVTLFGSLKGRLGIAIRFFDFSRKKMSDFFVGFEICTTFAPAIG